MVRLTSDAEGHILSRSDSEGGELGHVGAIRGFAMALGGTRFYSEGRKRQEAVNALLGGGDHHEDLRQYVYANGQQVGEVHAQYEMSVKWLQAGSTSVTVQAEDIVTRADGSLDRTATAGRIAQRVYGLGTLEHASARQAVIDAVAARLPADDAQVQAGAALTVDKELAVVDARQTQHDQRVNYAFAPLSGDDGLIGQGLSSHIVVAGETLRSIAQAQFGDSQYWYLIADANGLEGNAELKAGTTLIIPNQGTGAVNSKDTYKVYNEGDIIGATSPEIRTKKKKKSFFQKLVLVLVIVIAIVAAVFTAGAALAAIGPMLGVAGTAAAAGTLTAAVAGALTIGAVGTTLGVVATTLAVAAFGYAMGAVVSAASQGLMMAANLQDHFDWKAVRKGGEQGAVSAVAAGYAGAHIAIEAGKQLLTDGKVRNVSALMLAAVGGANAGKMAGGGWSKTVGEITDHKSTISAGLNLLETSIRSGDSTMAWTNFAVEMIGGQINGGGLRNEEGGLDFAAITGQALLTAAGSAAISHRYGEDAGLNYIGQRVGNMIAGEMVPQSPSPRREGFEDSFLDRIDDAIGAIGGGFYGAGRGLVNTIGGRTPTASDQHVDNGLRRRVDAGLSDVIERGNSAGMVSGNQPTSTSSLAEDGLDEPWGSLAALTEDERLQDLSRFGLAANDGRNTRSDVLTLDEVTRITAAQAAKMASINRLKALPVDQNALYVEPQQIADIKESLENGKRVKYSPELNAFIDLAGIEAKTHSRSNRGGTQRYYDPSTIKQVADVLTEIGGGILPLAVGFARHGATPEAAARSMLDYTGGYASNETKYNMFEAASRVGIVDLTPGLLESAAHIDSLLPRKGYISQASYESYQQALANNDTFTVSLHDQDSTHGDRMARARLYAYREDDLAPARLRDGARAQAEGQPWRDIFTVGFDLAFVMPWTKIGRMTAGGAKAVGGSVERFAALLNRSARVDRRLAQRAESRGMAGGERATIVDATDAARAASGKGAVPNSDDVLRLANPQDKLPRVRFSAETERLMGPAPGGMINPHKHHILEVNGRPGEHRALVREGQDILRSYDIDPLQGVESLVWAPNKGHTIAPAQDLVNELRMARDAGVGRDVVADILARHGQAAARR